MSAKNKNENLSFSFKIDTDEIQKELDAKIRDKMSRAINDQLKTCFAGAGYWDDKTGYGYDAINLAIETYLGSTEFETRIQETIQRFIDAKLEAAIEEATTRAARKMAYMITESKAKAMLDRK